MTIENPFQALSEKLEKLERKIDSLNSRILEGASTHLPDQGGIELAQEVTGLKRGTIYTLSSQGKIPCIKKGKKLYFSRNRLLSWISEGEKKGESIW